MISETFENLLRMVAPNIQKKVTRMSEPIGADQRLIVTLKYSRTGDAHTTIGANYRVSPITVQDSGRNMQCILD